MGDNKDLLPEFWCRLGQCEPQILSTHPSTGHGAHNASSIGATCFPPKDLVVTGGVSVVANHAERILVAHSDIEVTIGLTDSKALASS